MGVGLMLGTFTHWGSEPARVSVEALVVQGSVGLAQHTIRGREHLIDCFRVDVLLCYSHSDAMPADPLDLIMRIIIISGVTYPKGIATSWSVGESSSPYPAGASGSAVRSWHCFW